MEIETKDVILLGLGAATGVLLVRNMQEEPVNNAGILLGSLTGAVGIDYLTKSFR